MVTRRMLLHRPGTIGAPDAVYPAMLALDLESPAGTRFAPALPNTSNEGIKIGLLAAGLISANGLRQDGFDITQPQSRDRLGGRVPAQLSALATGPGRTGVAV